MRHSSATAARSPTRWTPNTGKLIWKTKVDSFPGGAHHRLADLL